MRFQILLIAIFLSACSASPRMVKPDASTSPRQGYIELPDRSRLRVSFLPRTFARRTQNLTVTMKIIGSKLNGGKSGIKLSLSPVQLTKYSQARMKGRGMHEALIDIATEVARRTYCPEGPITLSPIGTRRHFTPDQYAAALGGGANRPEPAGRVEQVPAVQVLRSGGTVRFNCDSPNPYVMSAPAQ